jgi:hypothetical protein
MTRQFPALVVCAAMATCAVAQTGTVAPRENRTFHLMYETTQAEQNELVTALRNMLDASMRIFLVASTKSVTIQGTPAQVKEAADLLAQLDVKRPMYRVTYTFTESDAGKRVGLQRYSMMLANGQRGVSKQGSRIPILVNQGTADHPSDRTYLDVGINVDAEVESYGEGFAKLSAKVEESSLAEEKSGIGPEDPIIRETLMEGASVLPLGKPQAIGALDIVGSTRHIDVEALVELVK